MHSNALETIFPNLRQTPYSTDSPRTPKYNCIAWAAGADDRPWWPTDIKPYYWPDEPRIESLPAFIQAFKGLGYEICDDQNFEPAFEKVAIYADESATPTHMARQLNSGHWSSKCGDLEDITHMLEGLEGDLYGKVVCIMKRPNNE